MQTDISIGKKTIGSNHPCYVIAEAGVNHNGDLKLALDLVRAAKATGADCVKFQTFKASQLATPNAPKANYQLKVTSPEESQFDMLQKLELQMEDYQKIIYLCRELDIQFLSTPYNSEDADFLNKLGVDAFKIASGQLVEIPFLKHVASLGKPIIISTGMANLAEVYEGISAIRKNGNNQIILLQCTTNYPSAIEDANINAMTTMQKALNITIGYSDHVPNNYACYTAVALGAKCIEKHFTLDQNLPGPDHSCSLNPEQFTQLVNGIRQVEKSLGNPVKQPTQAEIDNTEGMRRSIVAIKDIAQGAVIKKSDLGFKRPATGLAPKELSKIIGKKTKQALSNDTILQNHHLEWEQDN